MTAFFRANFGLSIVLILGAAFVIILISIGLLMKRAGVSLKPLWWFAGFAALILFPQLIGHIINSSMQSRVSTVIAESRQSPSIPSTASPSPAEFDYSDPQKLFGDKASGTLVVDGRATASGLLHTASDPKYFVLPSSETLLIGRFPTPERAEQAVSAYLKEARIADRARQDSVGGYLAQRGPSDIVYARAYGNIFTVWTGPNEKTIEQLQVDTGIKSSRAMLLDPGDAQTRTAGQDWTDSALKRATATWPGVAIVTVAFGSYLLFVAAYFLKGIAWATRTDAKPMTQPLSAVDLRDRLTAINSLDVPFRVEPGRTDRELVATWRYADAKWIDHARAHGMRRLHRVVLELDQPHRKVRATDYATNFDWSAGRSGANLAWKFVTGVTLFQYEHQRVFGLQVNPQGHFTPSLSYSYTFNLQEMKAPLVEAVTRSGWTWQPVAWNAPEWLKWLTE
jgi:hypothetical protein